MEYQIPLHVWDTDLLKLTNPYCQFFRQIQIFYKTKDIPVERGRKCGGTQTTSCDLDSVKCVFFYRKETK